jgi:hypothetical protein
MALITWKTKRNFSPLRFPLIEHVVDRLWKLLKAEICERNCA